MVANDINLSSEKDYYTRFLNENSQIFSRRHKSEQLKTVYGKMTKETIGSKDVVSLLCYLVAKDDRKSRVNSYIRKKYKIINFYFDKFNVYVKYLSNINDDVINVQKTKRNSKFRVDPTKKLTEEWRKYNTNNFGEAYQEELDNFLKLENPININN